MGQLTPDHGMPKHGIMKLFVVLIVRPTILPHGANVCPYVMPHHSHFTNQAGIVEHYFLAYVRTSLTPVNLEALLGTIMEVGQEAKYRKVLRSWDILGIDNHPSCTMGCSEPVSYCVDIVSCTNDIGG